MEYGKLSQHALPSASNPNSLVPAHIQSLSLDLRIGVEAVQLASRHVEHAYLTSQPNPYEKSAGDWLTEIDIQADHLIHQCLLSVRQGYPIISEELSPEGKKSPGRCWVVDPLDGTGAFLFRTGKDQPSVMIALLEDGQPILAVVHFPLTHDWFYAEKGVGAFLNGSQLNVGTHSKPTLKQSHVALNHYMDSTYETASFRQLAIQLRSPSGAGLVTVMAPHSGSACRLLVTPASMQVVIHDNNPSKRKQEVWDVAPVKLIVEEAGGIFWNSKGQPYSPFETDIIIATAYKNLAEKIISLL